MDVRLLAWEPSTGWSAPLPGKLDGPSTLVLAFGSPPQEVAAARLAELAAALPQAQLAGCSTAGEILDRRVADGGMSVAVARFTHTTLRRAEVDVAAPTDSRRAGRELAGALVAPGLRGVLVLSDGLRVNGTELLNGVKEVLPAGVVVSGGLAGDGDRFAATWVVCQGRPTAGVVSAVGLYGDLIQVGHGSRGGWDSFGVERQVTRSDGNVLYELDGEPALALYRRYLGDRAAGLPATALLFPLALCADDGGAGLVRTVLAVDEAEQSMTFAGDVPQGGRVQLMRANFDRLVEGAATAGRQARRGQDTGAGCLAVAISCASTTSAASTRCWPDPLTPPSCSAQPARSPTSARRPRECCTCPPTSYTGIRWRRSSSATSTPTTPATSPPSCSNCSALRAARRWSSSACAGRTAPGVMSRV
jgi:hypothetical protein